MMDDVLMQPWRKAYCPCGHETAWRTEYRGGQMWNVYMDGDRCPVCDRLYSTRWVEHTQERVNLVVIREGYKGRYELEAE
jgi:hypothetical protein